MIRNEFIAMTGRADERLRGHFDDGGADGQRPSREARTLASAARPLTADERARLLPSYAIGIRRSATTAKTSGR